MALRKALKTLPFYTVKKGEQALDITPKQVLSSKNSEEVFRQYFNVYEEIEVAESFYALYMNRRNVPVGIYKVGQGGICGTTVDIKLICKVALDCLASSVIICHNHPSGETTPSKNDIDVTNRIKIALLLLDTKLLDHIILTKNSYLSFADEGKM
jgi:DNA repair protein RadC